MASKFLRRTWRKFSKLGAGRKAKQKWKRPTGRDNKMRLKRKGYPAVVKPGYGTSKNEKGKVDNKEPVKILSINDLDKVGKNQIGVLGKLGSKKKVEILKKAKEKKIEIHNINKDKALKKLEKKPKKSDSKSEKNTEKQQNKSNKTEK